MPNFSYRYIKSSTGKLNKGRRYAYDEQTLRGELAQEGIDPTEIVADPTDPATERQIDYLRDLGVFWDGRLTKSEASDLITNAQEKKSPMKPNLQMLARHYRIEVTRFTSKERLYSRICATLKGNDNALAEWFVYRVYRTNCDRSRTTINDPGDTRLRSVASAMVADARTMTSLRKAARETVTGFRWFGTFVADDGAAYTGDSRSTACYKAAHAALSEADLLPIKPKTDRQTSFDIKNEKRPNRRQPITVGSTRNIARSENEKQGFDPYQPATNVSTSGGCLPSVVMLIVIFISGVDLLF